MYHEVPLAVRQKGGLGEVGGAHHHSRDRVLGEEVGLGVKGSLEGAELEVVEGEEVLEGVGVGEGEVAAHEHTTGHVSFGQVQEGLQKDGHAVLGHEGHGGIEADASPEL